MKEYSKTYQEEIHRIKTKIDDLRSYIASDFCTEYSTIRKEIKKLESKIQELTDQAKTV